jgi:glutamine synthetase
MLVVPQPETAIVDPFMHHTLSMTCNIQDPITREDYAKDPRNVARKAEAYMKSTGIADVANFGPEAEFFVFDGVRFDQNEHESYYHIESAEGQWTRGALPNRPGGNGNAGYKIRYKEGYFPVPPADTLQDVRTEMMLALQECGVEVEAQHHEVATAGQCEIDMKYGPLLRTADNLIRYKYVVKNVAARHGKTATFMPKPVWNDNGSGLHLHLSLWKKGESLFAGSGYGGLSQMALYAIGGILTHSASLFAFCCPTTNSYKRLVPGFEAPISGHSHSGARAECGEQADRVPVSRLVVESVPRHVGCADGGTRRHSEQDRSGSPARQGHLRSGSGRPGRRSRRSHVARRSPRRPAPRSRLSAPRRRLHRRRDRHVDLVQNRPRSRGPASATPSVGVRDVF